MRGGGGVVGSRGWAAAASARVRGYIRCCCRCRYRFGFREVQARTFEPPGFARSSTVPLRAQACPSECDDFFDARSEISDWNDAACDLERQLVGSIPEEIPEEAELQNLAWTKASPPGSPSSSAAGAGDALALLGALEGIERKCRGGGGGATGGGGAAGGRGGGRRPQDEAFAVGGDMLVECLLKEESAQFWLCSTPGCPVVTSCVWCLLPGVAIEDAIQAIRNPKERLSWDTDSLRKLDVFRLGDEEDPGRVSEVVHCVVKAPRPMRDREMLQHRWQLPLAGGGQAFVLRSFEDASLAPESKEHVRAFTHFSGYLLRPRLGQGPKGEPQECLELTVISRCDIGGMIPSWVQTLVRRLAKRQLLLWAEKLKGHCGHLREQREAPGKKSAGPAC